MKYYYVGGHAPIEGKQKVVRNMILCIVKHREHDAYLLLDREKMDWKSLVMGGVDDDDVVTAGIREIEEETGYTDITYLQMLDLEIEGEYYASHKDVNRYSKSHCCVYQLASGTQHTDPLDTDNHSFHRVGSDDVEQFLSNVDGLSDSLAYWYFYAGNKAKFDEYISQFTQL